MSLRTIAERAIAYSEAPDQLAEISQEDRIALRTVITRMFAFITYDEHYSVHFDFTIEDPYKYDTVREVRNDYIKGIIKVNVSGNNSELWGPVYNLMFRAIHDYIHAKHKLDFTYRDEIDAYYIQIKSSAPFMNNLTDKQARLYLEILRSEIVYQAAYKTHFNEFHVPVQKIILQDL
jgi:hypothetical protein